MGILGYIRQVENLAKISKINWQLKLIVKE